MGRGRAKAKQTKVARRLKYSSPDTDLEALRAELSGDATSTGGGSDHRGSNSDHESDDYSNDEYADKYADKYDDKYSDKYSDKYDPYAEYRDQS